MKRFISRGFQLLSILFVLTCFATYGYAQSKEEQEILKLSRKKFEWLITLQSDSIIVLLDDRIQYIHSNGWSQSKKEVLDDMHSGKLVYTQIDIKDDHVRVYGNTAIVTGKGWFAGVNNGKDFELDLVYTEVYIQTNKKWVLVSRHANRLL